jgi:ribosomal protein S27E
VITTVILSLIAVAALHLMFSKNHKGMWVESTCSQCQSDSLCRLHEDGTLQVRCFNCGENHET